MRKKRIQSPSRKTRGAARSSPKLDSDKVPSFGGELNPRRFLGVSLSGGKADKACIAVLEYYPVQKKIFLAKLIEKIKAEEFISADLKIHEVISQYQDNAEAVAFDVPLSLPQCTLCELKCPGYEACTVDEIKFIRNLYQQENSKKKPKKMYTPYTQRVIDAWLANAEPELDIQHALGANLAPLTTRALFISRRLSIPCVEVVPKLAVMRIGQHLKVNKSQLKIYRNSFGGAEAREIFLNYMSEKLQIFFYRQDFKSMVENFHAFEAFISGYTGFLQAIGKSEPRPANLPASEKWVAIPKMQP
jgi:hypothetical protein